MHLMNHEINYQRSVRPVNNNGSDFTEIASGKTALYLNEGILAAYSRERYRKLWPSIAISKLTRKHY